MVSRTGRLEQLRTIHRRYQKASQYQREYALRMLNGPPPQSRPRVPRSHTVVWRLRQPDTRRAGAARPWGCSGRARQGCDRADTLAT